ncbi:MULTISPECIES: RHS repeat domain-containing protein [Pseudomonas syringae group]|uniref:RHS repeat domain-containing protein n=1 Tax=Pseudomonas syringae group TaxID=136849 RepID=UPI000F0284BD|nr:RHS repeat-associated core domain-containing protein [Pseudomonas viridiflava]MBD8806422.1 RHS repeat-associated core domain-containing protein [Pseudomonas syringae]QVI84877.1 RHS repeat-associated core domain-containing protein [Pseudomonas viridiflava]
MNGTLHQHTPALDAFDCRGLRVRHVSLHRAQATDEAVARITAQRFNLAGQMIAAVDPRLGGAAQAANSTHVLSLTGQTLLTDSVDAGWRLVLFGEADQLLNSWDGRCLERRADYDDLLRPIAIIEQDRVVERFGYGAADAFEYNQCNQVIRHDDPAGSSFVTDYGVSGAVLDEARSFLLEPVSPDWPLAEPGRDALLESDRLHTRRPVNALGEVLEQTDVCGNVQRFHQTVAGQLKSVELTHSDITQMLVSDLRYNAFNQVEQETAGNGVISRYAYDPHTGRLNELLATSADGVTVQKLQYAYDPVGNVLEIEGAAHLNNTPCVDPVSHYTYDTLYQLIEAKGFEVKTDTSHGPSLPGMQNLPPDPNQIINYIQTYDYDAAGNLLTIHHVGAQSFTRKMRVAPDSNRSLPEGEVDTDFADSFDANGNLQQLVRGQSLSWNVRNQLQQITTVQRETGLNDEERYVYDGQGQRVRKINSAQASGRTLINEVRYLPGLEIRTTADGEILHVITAQAGRNGVRVLHWEAGKPDGIANDQVRYCLNDHLGSSTLELDQQGGLISQESYYPFGGTAWWAARSAVEAKYKTVRYSGKERDASGLYYYGFRYYAPWLQRWINPDPAGDVDGLNLYVMVDNNPLTNVDSDGLAPVELNAQLVGLAEKTAVELFRTGEALNPFLKQETVAKTSGWMASKIREMGYSRTRYGAATWDYAQKHFFKAEEEFAKDRISLTPDTKEGLHLFWATNTGARFINNATRNITSHTAAAPSSSFAHISNNVLRELGSSNGEHAIKLSNERRTKKLNPAMALLNKYHGAPSKVARLFNASLGGSMNQELYRGARVPSALNVAPGMLLTTSGFTAFTPDEKTAESFMGEKFHDADYVAQTQPVLFILQGGARAITSLTENEGLVEPQKKFIVTDIRQTRKGMNVFIKSRSSGEVGVWI